MINVPLRRLHKNDLTCFKVIAMTLLLITCQRSISAYYPRIVDCENDIVPFEWPSSESAKPFDIRGMYDHTIHSAKEIYHTSVPSGGGERKFDRMAGHVQGRKCSSAGCWAMARLQGISESVL
jgi:hypothetical protein